MMQGARFLYEAIQEYTRRTQSVDFLHRSLLRYSGNAFADPKEEIRNYTNLIRLLDDPNTKRILFDSRQAAIFDDMGIVEQTIQSKLHLPFDQFYLEFTEPIALDNQEPGFVDVSRAFVVCNTQNDDGLIQVTLLGVGYPAGQVEAEKKLYVDRTWMIDLAKGIANVPLKSVFTATDGANLPRLDQVPKDALWPVGLRLKQNDPTATIQDWQQQNRDEPQAFEPYLADPSEFSWIEAAVWNDTTLLSWCLAYIMAKSIVMVEEPLPRADRRRLLREGKKPEPWHVVKVDPKVMRGAPAPGTTGISHSYRYDVMGHLRFGKHPLKGGGYSETIEWVSPHQRGLANSVYIPKTYLVEKKGQLITEPTKGYFGRTS